MHQNDHKGPGLVVRRVQSKSDSLYYKLIQGLKNHKLGSRHVSFKWSTKEGTAHAIRMSHHDKTQFQFEAIKWGNVSDKIEKNGAKGSLKEFLKKFES